MKEYQLHLIAKDTGAISYKETDRRLRLFFPDLDKRVNAVTPEDAEDYYAAFRARPKLKGTGVVSVSYHRATLINARSFFKWCAKRDMVASNPFAEVEGIGKRKRGKAQHTGDEARRFYLYCLPLAQAGDKNALACLMCLLMAVRSADLCRRLVRDVDLDATVLRVSEGKTAKSDRPRHVPVALQAPLRRLAEGRDPFAPLFQTPYTKSGHHTRRWLEQAMDKLCEAAGVPRVVPHALKGTAGNILAETGHLADTIADHLSHESKTTTEQHYLAVGAVASARASRGISALTRRRPVSGTLSSIPSRPRRAK